MNTSFPTPPLVAAIFPLPAEITTILPLPVPNTVATPDIDNVITLLQFESDRLKKTQIDFSGLGDWLLSAGDCYALPPRGNNAFAYMQKRALLMFDIAAKRAFWHIVCSRFEEVIRGVHVIDPEQYTLLVDIKWMGEPGQCRRILRTVPVADLLDSDGAELALGPWPPGYVEPVTAANGTVLRYDRAAHEIRAHDASFEPVDHPLCRLFHDCRERMRLVSAIVLHQSRGMALLVDRSPLTNERYLVHTAVWDSDEPDIKPLPFVNREGFYCGGVEFSPDGAWVVIRDETNDDLQPEFVALRVLPSKPFFAPPIRLGTTHGGATLSTCWVAQPQAFVACDGQALYRWELV